MDKNDEPLRQIFKVTPKGICSAEINSIQNIDNFFNYLKDQNVSQQKKSEIIEEFIKKIQVNCYICEYFSTFDNQSIYIFLFQLYLDKNTEDILKNSILNLINELRRNIEINKSIFEYLFIKLSRIYREEDEPSSKDLNKYLTLLNSILGDTENNSMPKNYYCCSGEGKFDINLKDMKMKIGSILTIILNFKIGISESANENPEKANKSNLLTINFSNNEYIGIDLQYPVFLIAEKVQKKFIRTLPNDEWVNLVITLSIDKKINLYLFVNGENRLNPFNLSQSSLNSNDYIESISFFKNFYGGVSSISLFCQESGSISDSGLVKTEFLQAFKQYKEGIWKNSKLESFLQLTSKIYAKELKNNRTFAGTEQFIEKILGNEIEKLRNELYFVFTPFTYCHQNLIQSCIYFPYILQFDGNIRHHSYQCYQKKLSLIVEITNFIPIIELFLIHPQTLNENNLEIFLTIIINIVNYREHNLEIFEKYKIFQVLSLYIEKFPKNIFTEKILNIFNELGKCLFRNNAENLTYIYFKKILLNEKILSKYSEALQIKFWDNIMLFCQSDSTQMEKYIKMSRICLILRFYDRNKYQEICCEKHLSMIKDEFTGSKNVMNPPMTQKLSCIEGILVTIIDEQEPKNAWSLLKLLTLDLSPCLTEFIIDIFISAFQKKTGNIKWKNELISELVNNHFDVIIVNTFIHSLPEIRIELIKLLHEIYLILKETHNQSSFKIFEKILKSFLIPQNMFYFSKGEMMILNENLSDTNITKEINKVKTALRKSVINKNIPNNFLSQILNKNKRASYFIMPIGADTLNKIKAKYSNNNDIIERVKTISTKLQQENNDMKKKGEEYFFIIKDEFYADYKNQLLDLFSLWSFGINLDQDFDKINSRNITLKYIDILEILFKLSIDLQDINFTIKLLKRIENCINNFQSAYTILLNSKLLCLILDISFKLYISTEKTNYEYYLKSKSIIINIFINTFSYVEENHVMNPSTEIETILMWGDKMRNEETNINTRGKIFKFLNEIFLEYLTTFKIKFEPKMKFNINSSELNVNSNFFLKNYFITMNYLFCYSHLFKKDPEIITDRNTIIPPGTWVNAILLLYITSMNMNLNEGEKGINGQWIDYPFFDDIYRRFISIFGKNRLYKSLIDKKKIKDKHSKSEEILKKIILCKDKKNLYLKELTLLCYSEKLREKEIILPLIKIIPISIMCILSQTLLFDESFIYWLKEFKHYVIFLIIASSNLIKNEQEEQYNNFQELCLISLISCICYLKYLLSTNTKFKANVEKILNKVFTLCFVIVKYQYEYQQKKKEKMFIFKRKGRNNLQFTAVFKLFTEIIKNKSGQPLLTYQKLEEISSKKYETCVTEISGDEWKEAFFENNEIKEKVENEFYNLLNYVKSVDERYKQIERIKEETIEYNKQDILQLLPLYEEELAKYSNNSLEKNIKIKNICKRFKKKCFSWGGFWCDKQLFYENTEQLKFKICNHYTKNFMKPLLIPILDISYYLPEFSGFDPDELFIESEDDDDDKIYKLTIDMDKVLKIQDNTVLSLPNEKKELKENFTRLIYIKSNPDLVSLLIKITNNLDFGKEEEFSKLENVSSEKSSEKAKKNYFLGCLVKTSHHIKGVFFIDDKHLNFKVFLNQKTGNEMSDVEEAFDEKDDDFDEERQTCFGSYFVCHPKDKDLYKISIKYNDIKWIFRRRYYYKNSGLEIYTANNKTFYFNFKIEEEREIAINEILGKLNKTAKIIDDLKEQKDIYDNVVGYQNNLVIKSVKKGKNKIRLSKKLNQWKEWKMSTYEILMWLNIYGNRSFNDISQYPVFPWILSNYEDPLGGEDSLKNNNCSNDYQYRDLSLPMGMLELDEEGAKRKELFIETYEVLKEESDGEMKPYIYGSNYSNPMYVCNYLMRLFPFTHISIELQGSKFDDPNRLFLSVKNSFKNSTTQKTDVRELIPEFYYLPELFLNINKLNMGVQENGEIVDNVLTPCKNNPYEFIIIMKSILESEKISSKIQYWIDLIFGSKAKGKEAQLANNLFTEASYQEDITITNLIDKEPFLRRVEFGLIPTQLMSKDCFKRDKKEDILEGKEIIDPSAKIVLCKCKEKANYFPYQIKDDLSLLRIGYFSHDRIYLFLNDFSLIEEKISYKSIEKEYLHEIVNLIQAKHFNNYMLDFYWQNTYSNKVIQICNNGKTLIMGGFYDGKIKIISYKEQKTIKEITPFIESSPILALFVDQEEEYLFAGNSTGNVAVIKIDIELDKWEILYQLTEHISKINYVYCNKELNLWASTANDGYINIYTLPLCKLVRSIKVPNKNCSYSFLICSPLPCIVAICNDEQNNKDNGEIYVYSINGKKISHRQEYLISPIIIKDLNSLEYLAYISNGNLYIQSLPELHEVVCVSGLNDIYNICANEDMTAILGFNKNGTEITIIKDEKNNNKLFPS